MKKLLRVSLAVILIAVVASFAFTAGQQEPKPGDVAVKKTVAYWTHEHPQMVELTNRLIGEYEAKTPGVKIEYQAVPHKDYETKLLIGLTGGTGPDAYDIGDWNIHAYYEKGIVAPIDYEAFGYNSLQELKDAWWPASLSGFEINGQVYGIPMEYNTFSLFINDDHFKEIGLDPLKDYPKIWKELAAIGSRLVKKDSNGRIIREGFDWPHGLGEVWTLLTFEPLVSQYGGSLIDGNGKPTMNTPAVVNALTTYSELLTKYGVGDASVGASCPTTPNIDLDNGNLTMWITGPWAHPTLEKLKNYRVVPLPHVEGRDRSTILYCWSWVVNGMAPAGRQSEAWKWLNFLSSNQAQFLEKCGYLQPRKGWENTEAYKNFPFLDVVYDDMFYGKYMFRSTKWAEQAKVVHSAVEKAVLAGEDPRTVLDSAQADAQRIK